MSERLVWTFLEVGRASEKGWYETENLHICSSGGAHFVDATTDYLVTEWPYRTTVGFHDTHGWEVIELCERLFPMENRAATIQGNPHAAFKTEIAESLSTVTPAIFTLDMLGCIAMV